MSEAIVKMRECVNQVNIEGYVNSNNLVLKTDKTGKELITGSLDIAIDADNIIPVEVFSYKLKKDGTDNKIYKSLVTVMEQYKDATMVDGGYLNADKVKISNGTIRTNEFLTKDGTIGQSIKYSTNFLNRSDASFDPKATFKIEMVVKGLRAETKDGDETGRGFIDGFYVDYAGKFQPISLVAEGVIWAKLEAKIEKGVTMTFWGDIANRFKQVVKIIEADFGADREDIQTWTIKERIIVGCSVQEDDKSYDMDMIKQGIIEHAERLDVIKTTPRINNQQPAQSGTNTVQTPPKVQDGEEEFPWL